MEEEIIDLSVKLFTDLSEGSNKKYHLPLYTLVIKRFMRIDLLPIRNEISLLIIEITERIKSIICSAALTIPWAKSSYYEGIFITKIQLMVHIFQYIKRHTRPQINIDTFFYPLVNHFIQITEKRRTESFAFLSCRKYKESNISKLPLDMIKVIYDFL